MPCDARLRGEQTLDATYASDQPTSRRTPRSPLKRKSVTSARREGRGKVLLRQELTQTSRSSFHQLASPACDYNAIKSRTQQLQKNLFTSIARSHAYPDQAKPSKLILTTTTRCQLLARSSLKYWTLERASLAGVSRSIAPVATANTVEACADTQYAKRTRNQQYYKPRTCY